MPFEALQAVPQQVSAAVADDDDVELSLRGTQRNRQDNAPVRTCRATFS
jgi:hypothetical protein